LLRFAASKQCSAINSGGVVRTHLKQKPSRNDLRSSLEDGERIPLSDSRERWKEGDSRQAA
jgi:hypothetical protein